MCWFSSNIDYEIDFIIYAANTFFVVVANPRPASRYFSSGAGDIVSLFPPVCAALK